MGFETSIEWADHSFNPWIGCTRISPGCDHCYAETRAKRFGEAHLWQGERRLTSDSTWRQPMLWQAAAVKAGRRERVFCASLADVFDNQVPEAWRAKLWTLIRFCSQLDWLLLTKRPQNIAAMLPDDWGDGWANVWLGTTVENQQQANLRIPNLLATPAAKHFLSCEPLLEMVSLEEAWHGESALDAECWGDCNWCIQNYPPLHNCQRGIQSEAAFDKNRSGIDWVICGGESGAGARPMHPDWARSLRDQCAAAGVPFFFKQWGDWARLAEGSAPETFIDKGAAHFLPESGNWMVRIGKKKAGRLLDGRAHDEVPA